MTQADSLASPPMTTLRQSLGRQAEDLVAARLTAAGWALIQRNARSRYGEIDLVALDGEALVFVEVKAGRQSSRFGPERPILAVDLRKQRQVRRLAAAWMQERHDLPRYTQIRFDAIGVSFDRTGRPVDFEHLAGAF